VRRMRRSVLGGVLREHRCWAVGRSPGGAEPIWNSLPYCRWATVAAMRRNVPCTRHRRNYTLAKGLSHSSYSTADILRIRFSLAKYSGADGAARLDSPTISCRTREV
jgi:hypothetical protein